MRGSPSSCSLPRVLGMSEGSTRAVMRVLGADLPTVAHLARVVGYERIEVILSPPVAPGGRTLEVEVRAVADEAMADRLRAALSDGSGLREMYVGILAWRTEPVA